jgi:hypothetical protein
MFNCFDHQEDKFLLYILCWVIIEESDKNNWSHVQNWNTKNLLLSKSTPANKWLTCFPRPKEKVTAAKRQLETVRPWCSFPSSSWKNSKHVGKSNLEGTHGQVEPFADVEGPTISSWWRGFPYNPRLLCRCFQLRTAGSLQNNNQERDELFSLMDSYLF